MRNVQTHTKIHLNTGGMVESLKVITGDNVPCQHMHLISRWLKIRTINFSFILPRNIDHVFFWCCCSENFDHFASNSNFLRILSNLEENIFELKNEPSRQTTRDQYFESKLKEKWMVWILSHLKIRCIYWHGSLIRWLFEPSQWDDLTIPPVLLTFISVISSEKLMLPLYFWEMVISFSSRKFN